MANLAFIQVAMLLPDDQASRVHETRGASAPAGRHKLGHALVGKAESAAGKREPIDAVFAVVGRLHLLALDTLLAPTLTLLLALRVAEGRCVKRSLAS